METIEAIYTVAKLLLAFGASIITIGGAGAVIIGLIKWFKKPDQTRDEKVKEHEETLKKHTELLERDHRRLQALEEGNKIMMQSMLALMSHSIDGNHIEDLKQARDDLQKYIIRR
jgi:hypothetical protein